MRNRHVLCIGFLALGASVSTLAISTGSNPAPQDENNPYTDIAQRNVFALKPPPPPPPPSDANQPHPPSKITLQGITSILGRWQVLGRAQSPARPPEPAKETSFILSEGQREGDIEVVSIEYKTGTVKVINGGSEQILTMEKDGAKPPAGGAPGAPPPPGAALHNVPLANANPFPTRPMRYGQGGLGVMTSPGTTSPEGTVPGTPGYGGNGNPNQPPGPVLNSEQAAVLYEANRLKNEEATRAGLLPRLPTHPMVRGLDQQPVAAPVQNQPQIQPPFRPGQLPLPQ